MHLHVEYDENDFGFGPEPDTRDTVYEGIDFEASTDYVCNGNPNIQINQRKNLRFYDQW